MADQLAPKARAWGEALANAVTTTKNLITNGDIGEMAGLGLQIGFTKAVSFLAGKLVALFDLLTPKASGLLDGLGMVLEGLATQLGAAIKTGIVGALEGVSVLGRSIMPKANADLLKGGAAVQADAARHRVAIGGEMMMNGMGAGLGKDFIKGLTTPLAEAKRRWDELAKKATPERAVVPAEIKKATAPVEPTASAQMGKGTGASMEGDRLAKIGLFVGSGGGPANEHARRTADNTARIGGLMQRMIDWQTAQTAGGIAVLA
jgi:hypothetical protein